MSKRVRIGTGTAAFLLSVLLLGYQAPVPAVTGPIQTFEHADAMRGVVLSSDGQWAASWPKDTSGKIWSVASGAQKHLLDTGIKAMAFSPDGKRFAQATMYGVKLMDMSSGTLIRKLSGYWGSGVSFSPDSARVLYVSLSNHIVELRSAVDGASIHVFPCDYNETQYADFSADGTLICTAGRTRNGNAEASVWDSTSFQEIRKITIPETQTTAVGLAHNNQTVLVATYDRAVALFSVATGEKVRAFSANSEVVHHAVFSPDDTKVAAWGNPSGPDAPVTGTLWDTSTGQAIAEFRAPAAFSADGKYLVTGGDDQSAKLLDVSTLATVHTFTGITGGLSCAAFSVDSQRLALGEADKLARMFHIGVGQPQPGCGDLFNDPNCGEGTLLVAGMPVLSPQVQTRFTQLGWSSWNDADMESFDLLLQGQPVTVGDGLRDAYQVALVQYAITNPGLAHHDQFAQQYGENLAFFRADMDALQQGYSGDFIGMKSYDELFASMLGFSAEMQAAVNAFFAVSTDGTAGLPHAGQYHVLGLSSGAKNGGGTPVAPFAAAGDPDHDGLSNLEEFMQVAAAGGNPAVFAQVAFDPHNIWSGNPAVPAVSLAGLFLLCAGMCLGFVLLSRRRRTGFGTASYCTCSDARVKRFRSRQSGT